MLLRFTCHFRYTSVQYELRNFIIHYRHRRDKKWRHRWREEKLKEYDRYMYMREGQEGRERIPHASSSLMPSRRLSPETPETFMSFAPIKGLAFYFHGTLCIFTTNADIRLCRPRCAENAPFLLFSKTFEMFHARNAITRSSPLLLLRSSFSLLSSDILLRKWYPVDV